MKTYSLTFFIILVFAGIALGQATTANCPTVQVIGPSGVTSFGQNVVFTAKVEPSNYKLDYKWTVTEGTIVEGQGTPAITVISDKNEVTITGNVAVAGLPFGCANEASESAPIFSIGCGSPLDEWGRIKQNEIRAKMDIFFAELSNNPNDTGLVIFHITAQEKQTPDNSRIQLIVKHARFREFDLSRIFLRSNQFLQSHLGQSCTEFQKGQNLLALIV